MCTIYHPPIFEDGSQRVVALGLSVFNDTILGIAFEEGLSVIETRLVCYEESDLVSQIEPSEEGGAKIAQAVAQAVRVEPVPPVSQVFAI